MKLVVKGVKLFYLFVALLAVFALYAVFTCFVGWIIFVLMAAFVCFCLYRTAQEIETEEENKRHLAIVSHMIDTYCDNAEQGFHTVEIPCEDKEYVVELFLQIDGYEEDGVEFMGQWEKLCVETSRDIIIKKVECYTEDGSLNEDCFTVQELQDEL